MYNALEKIGRSWVNKLFLSLSAYRKIQSSATVLKNILDRANLEKELTKELETINKRIQLLAEKGIKNKGLEAAGEKTLIELNEILAQQKALENRELEKTVKFQERIAKIKKSLGSPMSR